MKQFFLRAASFSAILLCAIAFSLNTISAQIPTLDSEQWAFFNLINNYRAQNGVPPLQVSVDLQNSSQWMANDMATKNYFSHTDSLGRDPFTRMAAFGYQLIASGENIAAGSSDAQGALNQWINACDPDSSGSCTYAHRVNMLNSRYVVLGIGRAYNASSTYKWYWCTDFGAYVDQAINPPGSGGGSGPTINSFTATPTAVQAGQPVTLAWSVSGATSVSIDNGVGSVSSTGSTMVYPAQSISYKLTASNSAGSTSATVTINVTAPVDNQPPTPPFLLTAIAIGPSRVDVTWAASSDNVGVTGYQILRDGVVLNTILGPYGQSYSDTTVSPNTAYSYTIRAMDAAGNLSNPSNAISVTTPPVLIAPGPQSIVPVGGSNQSALIATAFALPLQAEVMDGSGNPVGGVTVTFTAPTSGATATFAGAGNIATAVTGSNGIVTSPVLTANGTAGTFAITASAPGLSPAAFTLTNTSGGTPSGTFSIWPDSAVPAVQSMGAGYAVELAVRFRSDVSGNITGIRFYKGPGNTGVHTGSLWSATGALLATGTFTNETPTGWQTLTFGSPVAISANSTYFASYHTNSGVFSADAGYFVTHGADNGPLHALQSTPGAPNGLFAYGPGGYFPGYGYNGNNFWVDVVFSAAGASPPPAAPQSVVAVAGTPQTANAGATFGTQLQAKALDASSQPVAGVTVVFTVPASGASASFPGGATSASAVTNGSGIATAPVLTANGSEGLYTVSATVAGLAPALFNLTNATAPPTGAARSIWPDSATPSVLSMGAGYPVELGVRFRSDVNGAITGIRFYKGPGNTGVHTGSLWGADGALLATGTFTNETASGWQTMTFASPVAISANTTYIASYHTNSGVFSSDFGFFQSNSADNGPLHALKSGVDGDNGLFAYGAGGQFPYEGYTGNNFWVDVLFVGN
jgi:uncharacterized protein YkwD